MSAERTEAVVELQDAAVFYRLARNRATSVQEYMFRTLKGQLRYETLWALRGVSLRVERGEVLGVIGANGAGKSTLMKLIARVLPPARGRVIVRGLVAPMIELGAGFHPDLTGFENIVLSGTILGRPARVMRQRAAEIAEWAGVSDFLDAPIRGYSSGMVARLAFSVSTDAVPDLLLVDEVLAVGDEAFRRRSQERISSMIRQGTAVVIVSHALDSLLETADTVLWIDHGRTVRRGDPQATISAYLEAVDAPADPTAGGLSDEDPGVPGPREPSTA